MWPNPQETGDLVTFTKEILNKKLHFLCSACAEIYEEYFNVFSLQAQVRLLPEFVKG